MSIKQLAVLGATALALFTPLATAKITESVACNHPHGKNINLSATEGGENIYFNNHCSEDMDIYYYDSRGLEFKAFTVHANTKGHDDTGGNALSDITAEPAK